nr:MAG TPA: hypothetical protein [Caudoviricetes sp.]DAX75144.1 MAG TPA: hypothetical protein [Caudoviricetes sp.]
MIAYISMPVEHIYKKSIIFKKTLKKDLTYNPRVI